MTENVKITFPDGKEQVFEKGVVGQQIADSISEGLGRAALAIKANEVLLDLTTEITEDSNVQIITFRDQEGVEVFRHSSAHLMAHAVKRLYPFAKATIGPVIQDGFFYDFDHKPFTPEDLTKIEGEMKKIVKEKLPIIRKEISKADALELFKDNEYKVELINELEDEVLTVYEQGDFVDLCRGVHCGNTSKIKSFKLTKASGAYWRGDADNTQLARIYGVSFPDKKELKAHLTLLEEARKRDHRKLGKELDLFSISDFAPGMPFFHNKGMVIWDELMKYWQTIHKKDGYQIIKTPIMMSKSLWETSGHWEHYREDMYTSKVDDKEYAIKPMNCPGGILVYKTKSYSYKDLPIKSGEIGLVHRDELSGALTGLFRVRCFHQDDAHIFMREDQIKEQIFGVLNLVKQTYDMLGIDYSLELSTRPEEGSIGSDENWEKATNGLKNALEEFGKGYELNPGDGAFYGPKIDIKLTDSLGRQHQCPTIQLDFNLPERFDLSYIDENNERKRPVMVHRVIYGSFERFIGILIEHFAGKFPLWMSPVQVKLCSVNDTHVEFCEEFKDELEDAGIRVDIDSKVESVPKKVRNAQLEKVNYILVVGDQEKESGKFSIRLRTGEEIKDVSRDDFVSKLKEEIKTRALESLFLDKKEE